MRAPRPASLLLALTVLLSGTSACGTQRPLGEAVVTIGDRTFEVQVARTQEQQVRGLQGQHPQANGGLLMTWPQARIQQIWMAEMEVALTIGWIRDGHVVAVGTYQPCQVQPPEDCPTYGLPLPVDAILEVASGALTPSSIGDQATIQYKEKSR